MKSPTFNTTQYALILAPAVLLLTTFILFRYLSTTVGKEKAYLFGFLFYWFVWCFLLPLFTVGIEGLKEMLSTPSPLFGQPAWLGIILLIVPPLLLFVTTFPSSIKGATLAFVIYSAMYAAANGAFEEIFWRGTYIVAFDGHLIWGYVYPSIWFGLWHLSPQVVEAGTVTRETFGFAFMSIGLGLTWGWVARTSGSVRFTALAHILLNFASPTGAWFIPNGS
ncbi:MAG: CPBP family intramembrane metalloprotease [Anaerolineales bacterium]|nr:CPBP family intramembrane metalloprotease [Anaerolineales bacterium]